MKPCVFSKCQRYRYTLWREWQSCVYSKDLDMFGVSDPVRYNQYLMVIGLNPSTADDTQDDPTIRRCINFAKRWGFGALCMTNLFAFRATLPKVMKAEPEPVGAENDRHLIECANGAGLILAAWGKHGSHLGRAAHVLSILPTVHRLRLNKDGSPEHPLYIPSDTVPSLYPSHTA